MSYTHKLAELQDYSLGNMHQYFEMTLYTALCFMLPIILSHPQIVVGIAVNAMLVLAALNLKGYKLLPVIIAPSLGALSGALLFGPFTRFLLYLAPFIWIGNAILVFSFKLFSLRLKQNYWLTLAIGSALKSGFLFLAALSLYLLGIIPIIFLTAMGVMQLATALGGGAGAYAFQYAKIKLTA
ncbi:hypothetical protein GF345_02705 [Candidatus Woesearchaeota archaeon]|nr:hypothetical protein [Candidatus Woesearchaeota archaeon]